MQVESLLISSLLSTGNIMACRPLVLPLSCFTTFLKLHRLSMKRKGLEKEEGGREERLTLKGMGSGVDRPSNNTDTYMKYLQALFFYCGYICGELKFG